MNSVIVVQARLGSSRLPGKVLLTAAGRPLLAHMLQRVRAARYAEHVVVATTIDRADDAIALLCAELGVDCYRGDPLDCLDRHYRVGEAARADAVVKIPSDCPLIDPAVIDRVLSTYAALGGGVDFVSNLDPPSWPDGNDVEVMSMSALRAAAHEATRAFDREHTTPFIRLRPDRFRSHNVRWETGLDYSHSLRFVVDWPEDYAVIRELIETLEPIHGPLFDVETILQLVRERPELSEQNAMHRGYSHWKANANAALHLTDTASKENRV